MSIVLQVIAVAICVGMMILLFKKMKQKAISEEQALYWLLGILGLLILSCFPKILIWVADILGIWWAPATLIFFMLLVIIFIIFHHTISISRMDAEIKELAMQVALLQDEKNKLEESIKKERGE